MATKAPHAYRILSLDGGGVRGLSALIVLRHFMNALTIRLEQTSSKRVSPRPCDHFDLICGSGTGGVLALFLGSLRMDVDEAIEAYTSVAEEIFGNRPLPHVYRLVTFMWPSLFVALWFGNYSATEDEAFQAFLLLVEYTFLALNTPSNPLFDEDRLAKRLQHIVKSRVPDGGVLMAPAQALMSSRTLVLACTDVVADAPPRRFRSYNTTLPADSTPIWDIARASCATPGLFSPVTIDGQTFIDAGMCGYTNPTTIALDEAESIWPNSQIGCILSIGTGRQGILTWTGTWSTILRTCQKLTESSIIVENDLDKRFVETSPQVYFRFNVDRGLDQEWINIHGPRGIAGITAAYLRFAQQESKLKICIARHASHDHFIVTPDMRLQLEKLHPVVESTWREDYVCAPGTREAILPKIMAWATTSTSPICWLHGPAGSGKSTIAETVVRDLDAASLLGAFFRCDRADATRNNPDQILLSILAELSRRIPRYAVALSDALRDPYMIPLTSPQRQIKELLVNLGDSLDISHPIVIVIDALDECGDNRSRKALFSALKEQLPHRIKLFFTSRPELDIVGAMAPVQALEMQLDIGDDRDVKKVLKDRLLNIRQKHYRVLENWLSPNWISDDDIDELIKRAGGLFIYARFTASLLDDAPSYDALATLNTLLSPRSFSNAGDEMDELYLTALRQACPGHLAHGGDIFQRVMGPLLALKTPLDLSAFTSLLSGFGGGSDKASAPGLILALRPVLLHGENRPIAIVHPSFFDFVTARCKDPSFRIHLEEYPEQLARCCFAQMKKLRRDICRIGDTTIPNRKVEDLSLRLDIHVPESLRYACRFWASHLSEIQVASGDLMNEARFFLLEQLLYWIEVMSLLGEISSAEYAMRTLKMWLHVMDAEERLQTLAHDGMRFIGQFQAALQENALHTYYSALPFFPSATILFEIYGNRYNNIPRVVSHRPQKRDPCVHIIPGHTSGVASVAFSPEGSRIVSGSDDKTICIWDASTGALVGKPFSGHTHWVRSVSFSPDGSRIVSGSDDQTIRIWEVSSGAPVGEPLRGHTAKVRSVIFSPDGSRIASGSYDRTVRIWDVITGAPVGKPLHGHEGSITSLAFSPDGSRIVSGSLDWSIRIWDSRTGSLVRGPLYGGHNNGITSVSFSPDGSYIVSGSVYGEIQLWEVSTGLRVGKLSRKYETWVTSVTFSPDGSLIASGSDDNTIRIWDARTGASVREACYGHSALVTSVDFSPDGSRVVSGSLDQTIRVWDVSIDRSVGETSSELRTWVTSLSFSSDGSRIVSASNDSSICVWDTSTGTPTIEPLLGHEAPAKSVAFSPDGSHIISGSSDRTIRIWNARTGVLVGKPLRKHTGPVRSVSFSPDGSHVISGSDDGTICICDANTGTLIGELFWRDKNRPRPVSLILDGHIVGDQTVRILDVSTGLPVGEPLSDEVSVTTAAFSLDGSRIILHSDNTIRMFDTDACTVSLPGAYRFRKQCLMKIDIDSVSLSPRFKLLLIPGVHCVAHPSGTLAFWNSSTSLTIIDLCSVSLL